MLNKVSDSLKFLQGSRMVHLIDMFSPPQTLLLANTIEYFHQKQIPFDPEYVYWDIHVSRSTLSQMIHLFWKGSGSTQSVHPSTV
jgi:hypothetical protein